VSTDDGTNEVKKQGVQGSAWRAAIEQRFEAWGRGVVRQRWLALILSVAATGFLLSYLPQLEIDNSTESMLMADDPAVIQYNAFREQFGRDDKIIVAVDGGDIFSLEFLEQLRVLHEAIEAEVPHVTEVVVGLALYDPRLDGGLSGLRIERDDQHSSLRNLVGVCRRSRAACGPFGGSGAAFRGGGRSDSRSRRRAR
jgi:hypothetical protein